MAVDDEAAAAAAGAGDVEPAERVMVAAPLPPGSEATIGTYIDRGGQGVRARITIWVWMVRAAITPRRFLAASARGLGGRAGDCLYRVERYHPTAAVPSQPPRNGHERIPYSVFYASGSIQAISGSRPGALADSVGARGTSRQPSWSPFSGTGRQSWTRRHLREARIFTGGVAPAGYNVKILWTFLAPLARSRAVRNLVVQGHQLDGSATFRQQPFSRISSTGQRGAASYASIINVPHPGCWRLDLKSRGLSGHIQFRAVPGRGLAVEVTVI